MLGQEAAIAARLEANGTMLAFALSSGMTITKRMLASLAADLLVEARDLRAAAATIEHINKIEPNLLGSNT